MSFSIDIDSPIPSHPSQPSGIYYPGQTIHGTLSYTIPKQRSLHSITLTLRAKLETYYVETRSSTGAGLTHGPRKPMRETIRLFEENRKLFEGPYDVPAQTFQWKFEFVVPRGTHVDRSGVSSGKKGGNKGFIDDGYGELPPSFEWQDKSMSHDSSAKIRYKFVARAESGGLFATDEKEWPIQIRRVSESPDSQLISVEKGFQPISWSSHKLRPEGEKLNMRQRLRSVVSDNPELGTPSLNFKAWVGMPRCFNPDQKFDVNFRLVYEKKGDLDPDKPTLMLDSVKFAFKTRTEVMIKRGSFAGMTISGDRQCEGRHLIAEKIVKLGDGGSGITLPLDGEAVKVGELCVGEWKRVEDMDLIGDFVTWIINHGYWMSIEAVVRHVQTGRTWNLPTGFVIKLRDEYVPELVSAADERHDQEEDVLPGYEDDVQPPEHEDGKARGGNSTLEKSRSLG